MAANTKVLFKFGTSADYAALETKLSNALYFLTDTGELYRGATAIGQAHIFTGTRQSEETNSNAITRIVGNAVAASNDLAIITNANSTKDVFIYDGSSWVQLNSTNVIETQVATLESTVSDLDALINGTPADPEHQIAAVPGLLDRVEDLETQMSAMGGAFHFKGTTADLNLISNPGEGDVYQVGSDEYAWNGSTWVKLGGEFDTSGLATQTDIADLEALIGAPATTTTVHNDQTGEDETVTIPASGIYSDLANHAADIIPVFDGDVSGLVPVAGNNYTSTQKANLFMNALGQWTTVTTSGGGQSTYTAPDGTVYSTVEAYVERMIGDAQYEWETIS